MFHASETFLISTHPGLGFVGCEGQEQNPWFWSEFRLLCCEVCCGVVPKANKGVGMFWSLLLPLFIPESYSYLFCRGQRDVEWVEDA